MSLAPPAGRRQRFFNRRRGATPIHPGNRHIFFRYAGDRVSDERPPVQSPQDRHCCDCRYNQQQAPSQACVVAFGGCAVASLGKVLDESSWRSAYHYGCMRGAPTSLIFFLFYVPHSRHMFLVFRHVLMYTIFQIPVQRISYRMLVFETNIPAEVYLPWQDVSAIIFFCTKS